jgi:hypothetical protein
MPEHPDWPALPYEEWAATKKTLHMVAQMVGKAKLAVAPPQPEWLNACLFLDPRGFATGPLPYGTRIVAFGIDVVGGILWAETSDGGRADVPLSEGRSVADIWQGFQVSLTGLGLELDIWEKPQEVPDATPFSQNTHDRTLDLEQAQRYHRVLSSVNGVFEEFRSRFFGRSGVQFWWGAFDLAVLLFNGRPATAPTDRGYIMRYDLDAEHFNAGFWAGDDVAPQAGFFGYVVPQPPGCAAVPMAPEYAGWVEEMGEWLMPYDTVRTCPDPRAAILDFLDCVYGAAVRLGGWDAAAHEYIRPPASLRGHETKE